MNRKPSYIIALYGKIIFVSFFILMTTGSCYNRKEKTNYKDIIPEKDFISILTELHLTNGLLALPEMRRRLMINDTSRLYVKIIEGYGYSTAAMDTTIQYYYIKNPRKLIRIYDQMLGKFSEMETRLEHEFLASPDYVDDQWEGESSYLLPDPRGTEIPGFELKLTSPGTYALKFSVTIFPDDQSYNPCFTAWLCDADSSETGRKNYLPSIRYIKDGRQHYYTVTGTFTDKSSVILKGRLYDFASNPDSGEQNAIIENISFYYSGAVK